MFSKKTIGLDIADNTIEVIELQQAGGRLKVWALGRMKISPGIIERGRIKNKAKLVEDIKKLFEQAKPHPIIGKDVVFGLSESQVYTQIIQVKPKIKENEIVKEIQKNIPLHKEDLVYSYKRVNETKEVTEILVIAASRKVVLEWQEFFEELKMKLEFLDAETLATFRGLSGLEGLVCVVDIGAANTSIGIFDEGNLRYSHAINLAGNTFTSEIAKTLNISLDSAEGQKIKLGLSDKESQVYESLAKSLEPIAKELQTIIKFFGGKTKKKIDNIVLIGGSSKLKGIIEYFFSLGLKVILGQSVLHKSKLGSEYIGAIGLSLRGLSKKYADDPSFAFVRKIESVKEIKPLKPEERTFKPDKKPDKMRSKKIALVVILIIGIVLISLAFWYRSNQRNKEVIEPVKEIIEEVIVEEEPIVEEINPSILILDTPTGWLRVRSGPGTEYEEITKINPGESYPLLEESEEWYKIKVGDEEGWIFKDYANKE